MKNRLYILGIVLGSCIFSLSAQEQIEKWAELRQSRLRFVQLVSAASWAEYAKAVGISVAVNVIMHRSKLCHRFLFRSPKG